MFPSTILNWLKVLLGDNANANLINTPESTEPIDQPKTEDEMPQLMINTLAFSSDMETLYLIDNGRCIPFDLTTRNGVLVGTLKGQITVATALQPEADIIEGDGTTSSTSPASSEPTGGETLAPAAVVPTRRIRLSIEDNQWTSFFNQENEVLFFVGATEIDVTVKENRPPTSEAFLFSLVNQVVRIRKDREFITISPTPSGTTR